MEIVNLLLKYGANGRPTADTGITPLYAACFVGNLKVVKALLKELPNLLMEPTTKDRSVPLHEAAMRGHLAIVEYLLTWRQAVRREERVKKQPQQPVAPPGSSVLKRRGTKPKRSSTLCVESFSFLS